MNLKEIKNDIIDSIARIESGSYDNEHTRFDDYYFIETKLDEIIKYAEGYKKATNNLLSPAKGKTVGSNKAAKKIKPVVGTYRHRIMQHIFAYPGITYLDIVDKLDIIPQTVSARLHELKKAGWVKPDEKNGMARYTLTDEGRLILKGLNK